MIQTFVSLVVEQVVMVDWKSTTMVIGVQCATTCSMKWTLPLYATVSASGKLLRFV